MKKQKLGIILLPLTVGLIVCAVVLLTRAPANTTPISYTYEVVRAYPHDPIAFTQGLVIDEGILYESTGLWGYSTLRRVDLETGAILQMHSLPEEFFGEGITIFGDKIIQLTWQNQVGFVYDKQTFELLQNFSYPTEGWGITHDGKQLIMSDGTANLYFLDPETFQRIGQVEVRDGNVSVTRLNELEFVKGDVYANVWGEEKIAIISPQTGQVKGWIDLAGIYTQTNQNPNSVLNGIAYDAEADRLFVTGKLWTQLFEIKLIERK
ncbi:MAG: glutaminyl-peptide cyclotransferase [Candidatus Bathyarchaeota archaeon]|nr:glutaminyl-peptide cyclotransferase [Candidatus Bathyarchaeota archaeon]